MEKTTLYVIPVSKRGFRKILIIMKLTLIMIYLSVLQINANGFPQVSVSLNSHEELLQQPSISGTVTDEKGNPVPGVTVMVKGTNIGALSDLSGKYILNNVPPDATLSFSFVGMISQDIPAEGRMLIDVIMKEDVIGLEEIVVVGYGTQKKATLTGSIVMSVLINR